MTTHSLTMVNSLIVHKVIQKNMDLYDCNGGFIFQVEDQQKMYREQWRSGLHMPLVFGDYTQELKMLAESYGMEAILV